MKKNYYMRNRTIIISVLLIVCVLFSSCSNNSAKDNSTSSSKTRAVDSYNEISRAGLKFKVPDYFEPSENTDNQWLYAEHDEKLVMLLLDTDTDDGRSLSKKQFKAYCDGYYESLFDGNENNKKVGEQTDINYYETNSGLQVAKSSCAFKVNINSFEYMNDRYEYLINNPEVGIALISFSQSREADYDYTEIIEQMILNCETIDSQPVEEEAALIDSGNTVKDIISGIEDELDELKLEDKVVSYERSDDDRYLYITWPGGSKDYESSIRFFTKQGKHYNDVKSSDEIPSSMSIITKENVISGNSTSYMKGVGADATELIMQILDPNQYKEKMGDDLNSKLKEMINEAGSNMEDGAGIAINKIGTHKVTLLLTRSDSDSIDETFTIKF